MQDLKVEIMVKFKSVVSVIIFWTVLLFGFVLTKEYTLSEGEEILLKIAPKDPRDLFRGDYVVLTFDINEIDLSTVQPLYDEYGYEMGAQEEAFEVPPEEPVFDDEGFTADTSESKIEYNYDPHENFYVGRMVYVSVFNTGKYWMPNKVSIYKPDSGLFLVGTVVSFYGKFLRVNYGFENYFIQEGTGKEIEALFDKLEAVVAVDKFGNALIKQLLYDGVDLDEYLENQMYYVEEAIEETSTE